MKKLLIGALAISMISLAGCGSSSNNTITVGNFSLSLPTTFQSVSSSSLDQSQIAHTIIAARKGGTSSLVLSESSLPSPITLQQFTQDTQSHLSESLVGYSNGKISSSSFTCNGKKISAYKHTFTQTAFDNPKKIIMYYNQFYYALDNAVYILSLAHPEENSIFSDITSSLGCVAKK